VEELILSAIEYSVSDVRQVEIHTAESGPFEVENAIAKLKRYNSPVSVKILAELIQAGGETLHSEIHELINSIWNKEELSEQWKESVILPVYRKSNKTDIIIQACHCYELRTRLYLITFTQG
jgi:hypothetical protein